MVEDFDHGTRARELPDKRRHSGSGASQMGQAIFRVRTVRKASAPARNLSTVTDAVGAREISKFCYGLHFQASTVPSKCSTEASLGAA